VFVCVIGNDGGSEPGIDNEDRGYDNRPDGDERCVCSCSGAGVASSGCSSGMVSSYDGPASAEQCAHLLCSSPINTIESYDPGSHQAPPFYHDTCSWVGISGPRNTVVLLPLTNWTRFGSRTAPWSPPLVRQSTRPPFSPARLFSAPTTATHLTRWQSVAALGAHPTAKQAV
jgi:hypothetical protein